MTSLEGLFNVLLLNYYMQEHTFDEQIQQSGTGQLECLNYAAFVNDNN